jgi:hypothetical protein
MPNCLSARSNPFHIVQINGGAVFINLPAHQPSAKVEDMRFNAFPETASRRTIALDKSRIPGGLNGPEPSGNHHEN